MPEGAKVVTGLSLEICSTPIRKSTGHNTINHLERTPQPSLKERLRRYQQWRARVADAIKELGGWLEGSRYATAEARACIEEALAAIRADRLTVAFLSEGGSAKSVLIDALFSDDYLERRLPPHKALGDTCTTELCWDPGHDQAYLRLLPIETLGRGLPFARLHCEPAHWIHRPLDPQDPEQTAMRLSEVAETKDVSHAEAVRLGLAAPAPSRERGTPAVSIPTWRHAIISFPSPLMRLGIAIVDIPSLTPSDAATQLLAQAQVIVCVVADDQATDLKRWQRLLRGVDRERLAGVIVAMDEGDAALEHGLEASAGRKVMRRLIAAALGVGESEVLAASAQRALIARTRADAALLRQSGVAALEDQILSKLLGARRQTFVEGPLAGIRSILARSRASIRADMDGAKMHLEKLAALRDQTGALMQELLNATRLEQEGYLRAVQRFHIRLEALALATKRCSDILEPSKISNLAAGTDSDLSHSWTTAGMGKAMNEFFEELRRAMQVILSETEHIRDLVGETYAEFEQDFGFQLTAPKVFAPMTFAVELELLYQELDAFRHSASLALAERRYVIRRFQTQMAGRALTLFDQLRAAFDTWGGDALQPIADRIKDDKTLMERRLDNLQRLGRSYQDTSRHLGEIQAQYAELARELAALDNINDALGNDSAPSGTIGAGLQVAAQRA